MQLVGVTGSCASFCAALDGALESVLGGSSHGIELLSRGATELLAEVEAEDDVAAQPDGEQACRARGLLGALGRLYERSHLLIASAALPRVHNMEGVCEQLLGPFPQLEPTVRRLVEEHR